MPAGTKICLKRRLSYLKAETHVRNKADNQVYEYLNRGNIFCTLGEYVIAQLYFRSLPNNVYIFCQYHSSSLIILQCEQTGNIDLNILTLLRIFFNDLMS